MKDITFVCDKCGKPMVIKWGRHGKFLACTGFPKCKNTKEIAEIHASGKVKVEELKEEVNCEKCGSPMVLKVGRFGKFLACSKYPECYHTRSLGIGMKCPKKGCEGDVVRKTTQKRRSFYGCSRYPKCDFISWEKPVKKTCPLCKAEFLGEKKQKNKIVYKCMTEACGYKSEEEITEKEDQ